MGRYGCGANLMGIYGVVVAAVWSYGILLRIHIVTLAAVPGLWGESIGLYVQDQ